MPQIFEVGNERKFVLECLQALRVCCQESELFRREAHLMQLIVKLLRWSCEIAEDFRAKKPAFPNEMNDLKSSKEYRSTIRIDKVSKSALSFIWNPDSF